MNFSQSYKQSTIVNYDTSIVLTGILPKEQLKRCNLLLLNVYQIGHRLTHFKSKSHNAGFKDIIMPLGCCCSV